MPIVRKSQKDRERRFAQHFLEIDGRSVAGLVEGESPDFVLAGSPAVGLEVRELFRDSGSDGLPRQAREGSWTKIADRAKAQWVQGGHPHIEVWLFFNSNEHISSRDAPRVAEEIVALASEYLPPHGERVRLDILDFEWGSFPEGLISVTISRLVDYSDSYWHVNDGGWVSTLRADVVQGAIDAKAKKYQEYSKRCDEVWLLLVLHAVRPSSAMDVPEGLTSQAFIAPFDRVVIFDTLAERVHELQVLGARPT